MKVLQIFSFYYDYLQDFYSQRPGLGERAHSEILGELKRDGFGAVHFYGEDLRQEGCEVHCLIANDPVSQAAWMRENGVSNLKTDRSLVVRQTDMLSPDVLLINDPVGYESRFVRSLAKRPKLVLGWRAASVPKGVDWTEFDAILSNHEPSLKLAEKLGAANLIWFHPGFPRFILEKVSGLPKTMDVSFTGSLSSEHRRRYDLLEALAKAHTTKKDEFSLAFFAQARPDLSDLVNSYCRGSRWGMEMYRTLAESKININSDPDFTDARSANMRQFEVTGCGGFLLTEYKESIREYFQPGVEIETFKSHGEALEKISYYLSHPEERERIAANGQRACLERFSREIVAKKLSGILQTLQPSNNFLRRIKREFLRLKGV